MGPRLVMTVTPSGSRRISRTTAPVRTSRRPRATRFHRLSNPPVTVKLPVCPSSAGVLDSRPVISAYLTRYRAGSSLYRKPYPAAV